MMLYFIDDANAELPAREHPSAIVTLLIGEHYQAIWEKLCRASWEAYANHCGLDIIVIRTPLDTSARAAARSPAWQKLLIFRQPWAARYERIIWLDADIIINPHAQSILPYCPDASKIGITISQQRLSEAELHIYHERIYKAELRADKCDEFATLELAKNFEKYGISEFKNMYNTGVLVMSPQHHAALFDEAYATEDTGGRLYEQPILSSFIDRDGLAHVISARFNWGMIEAVALYVPYYFNRQMSELPQDDFLTLGLLLKREFRNAYFLHFYGSFSIMESMTIPLTLD